MNEPLLPLSVSIVIPTHNRRECLRQCLEALAAQRHPAHDFEVVVVADGCTDGTAAFLASARYPFALRVYEQGASGAATARNRGAEEARGALLIFLDDDVIASPGLIDAHLRAHSAATSRVAVGPYRVAAPTSGDFFAAINHAWWETTCNALDDGLNMTQDYRNLLGGNVSMTRTTFTHVGGFNPEFACLEDPELGIRLLRQGVRLVGVSDAHARHLETTDVRRSFQRARQEGEGHVRLADLHPSVRPTLRLARVGLVSRWLVFDAPVVGRALARIAAWLLAAAQYLRLRWLYGVLYGALRHYWYCRGVAERAGTRSALARLRAAE